MLVFVGSQFLCLVGDNHHSVAADHILDTARMDRLQDSCYCWQELGNLCRMFLWSGSLVLFHTLLFQMPGFGLGRRLTDKYWLELGMIGNFVLQDNYKSNNKRQVFTDIKDGAY